MVSTLAQTTATGATQQRLVRVAVGELVLALPLASVAAVLEPTMIARQAGGGAWLGDVQSRLGAIAVFDAAQLLRLESSSPEPGRVLVLRGEQPVGIAVERVLDAIDVRSEAVVALPATARLTEPNLIAAVVWVAEGEVELLLDVPRLVVELLRRRSGNPQPAAAPDRELSGLRRRLSNPTTGQILELWPTLDASPVGVPVSSVRYVADYRAPHPLPLADADVLGLLAWLRQPIPVIDLAARLGVADATSMPGKVIVVGEPALAGSGATSAFGALAVHQIGALHTVEQLAPGEYLWTAEGQLRLLDLGELLLGR